MLIIPLIEPVLNVDVCTYIWACVHLTDCFCRSVIVPT